MQQEQEQEQEQEQAMMAWRQALMMQWARWLLLAVASAARVVSFTHVTNSRRESERYIQPCSCACDSVGAWQEAQWRWQQAMMAARRRAAHCWSARQQERQLHLGPALELELALELALAL